jgi:hypothetical protein
VREPFGRRTVVCAGTTTLFVMACGMYPRRLIEHVYSSFVVPAATSVSLNARQFSARTARFSSFGAILTWCSIGRLMNM